MLRLRGLETGYGKKQVLFGIDLDAEHKKITAIIGPNGSGKSTALKVIMGIIQPWRGRVMLDNCVLNGSSPQKNSARGVVIAPQGNRVFDSLQVSENLEIGGFRLRRAKLQERIEYVLGIFPDLKNKLRRRAGQLSGGEQQMVALARSLIPEPRLLLLDEPSLGLSPRLVNEVFNKLVEMNDLTRITILIVEQKVREVLRVCHSVVSLKLGKVAFSGSPDDLEHDNERLRALFL